MTGAGKTRWDANRAKAKGQHDRAMPRCSRCSEVSGLDPCRACATPAELAKYPPPPDGAA